MTLFLQVITEGISAGSVYALLALGFVIIFKATEVVNFAHPGVLMVGTFTMLKLQAGARLPGWWPVSGGKTIEMNFWPSVLVGVLVGVLTAVIIERVLVRTMGTSSIIAVSIMTIGVDLILQQEARRRLGPTTLYPDDPWGNEVVRIGDVTIAKARLAALFVSLVLIVAFFLWFKFSNWGVAMRATAFDPGTASLMGIRQSRVSLVAWGIAGALAVVAGLFLSTFPGPGFGVDTSSTAFRAFPAAIIGGLDSTGGAIAGGLMVGVAELLCRGYSDHIDFLGTNFDAVVPYVLMVIVLLMRPAGLFGTKAIARV